MNLLEMKKRNLTLKDLTDQELEDILSETDLNSIAYPAIAFEFQFRLSGRENYVPPRKW